MFRITLACHQKWKIIIRRSVRACKLALTEVDAETVPLPHLPYFLVVVAAMFPSLSLLSSIVSTPFKRSQLGLFHGKTKQYGNSVPNSKHKTRRTWLPNVHNRRLFSDTLQQHIRVKLTARALKTVNKASVPRNRYVCEKVFADARDGRPLQHGGIDKYLLKTKPELLGWEGMRLRMMVREKQQEQQRAAAEQPVS